MAKGSSSEKSQAIPFSSDFQEIIDKCRSETKNPSEKSGMLQTWARLQLDAVRYAKEEQRALEAAFVAYQISYEDPLLPDGDVPPLPEIPGGGD